MVNDEALDQIFRKARTYSAWLDKPVSEDMLHQLYDLLKWPPTSANTNPGRFVFLHSQRAKERLRPALAPGNVAQTMTAPVTVIIGYDLLFNEKLPRLFPHSKTMRELFASNPQLVEAPAGATEAGQGSARRGFGRWVWVCVATERSGAEVSRGSPRVGLAVCVSGGAVQHRPPKREDAAASPRRAGDPARGACGGAGVPGSRSRPRRIRFATRSLRICWKVDTTSERCRSFWGIVTLPRRFVYTHVLNRAGGRVMSPADTLR